MNTDIGAEADTATRARDWLLRLALESPDPEECARFAAWCAEDARHVAAYRRIESIWEDAATLHSLASLAVLPEPPASRLQRWLGHLRDHQVAWAACTSMVCAIFAVGVWLLLPVTHYATGVAEVRTIRLADGSDVTLGARTQLNVSFRDDERRVALTAGEAFFSVTKNAARPFVVVVGNKEVRVVGTKFEVRRTPDNLRVAVVEGTVVVMPMPAPVAPGQSTGGSSGGRSPVVSASRKMSVTVQQGARADFPADVVAANADARVLSAGQQLTAAMVGPMTSALAEPTSMPHGEAAAWRYGRLEYVDAPLKDIVADANRYSNEPIVIADEPLADVRVSLTYRSDRVSEMLSALSQGLKIDVERPSGGGVVLRSHERGD